MRLWYKKVKCEVDVYYVFYWVLLVCQLGSVATA